MAIAASGPSLAVDDLERLRGKLPLIAVNNVASLAPWAALLYACDGKWWDAYPEIWQPFRGERWTQDRDAATRYGLRWIEGREGFGISTDRGVIHYGRNSGFQAMNLAALAGARRIVLTGFDMRLDRGTHWHGDHGRGLHNPTDITVERWRRAFDEARVGLDYLGCEVVNATKRTALDCFPRVDLEAVI